MAKDFEITKIQDLNEGMIVQLKLLVDGLQVYLPRMPCRTKASVDAATHGRYTYESITEQNREQGESV